MYASYVFGNTKPKAAMLLMRKSRLKQFECLFTALLWQRCLIDRSSLNNRFMNSRLTCNFHLTEFT